MKTKGKWCKFLLKDFSTAPPAWTKYNWDEHSVEQVVTKIWTVKQVSFFKKKLNEHKINESRMTLKNNLCTCEQQQTLCL